MSNLAPPGSSTYNSDTMHVGDGTWDAGRDDFLLPNLVGLNFDTMRYNGMGNRFYTLNGYQSLVKAHGIIAAITFLFIIPAAIFAMRFYGRRRNRAVRIHIWLQITTLLLVTVVFVIGWFQVGPRRSLTNPHHGIGLALFVLIWVQVIGGALVNRSEKRKRTIHIPLKAMIHHWLGRAVALLGIAQVALGLTLYGSPLSLFVLFALWVFALLLAYFILEYLAERKRARYSAGTSEYTEEIVETRPSGHGGFGRLAGAGIAGAGIASLFNRRNKRQRRASESDVTYNSASSASGYYQNEKPTEVAERPQRSGFGRRLLEIGAIGGGLAAAKSIFSRKRRNDYDDDSVTGDQYRPPLGGNHAVVDPMARVEEGQAVRPVTPNQAMAAGGLRPSAHPLAQPPMTAGSAVRPDTNDEYSYYDYESSSPSRQGRRHGLRQAIAAGGVLYGVKSLFRSRKDRREEDRAESLRQQRIEQERVARTNSQHRYTGNGVGPSAAAAAAAPLRPRHNRMESQTASDVSSLIPGQVQRPGALSSTGMPLAGAGIGAAAASALSDRSRIRPVGTDPTISTPGPNSATVYPPPAGLNSNMPTMAAMQPPIPPPHGNPEMLSSGSEIYTTASGRQGHRHHLRDEAAAGLAGAGLGAAAAGAHRRRSTQTSTPIESPPVSLHIKPDGNRVTLRRLTEEEAAAQRAARRTERRNSRRRRNSSFSDSSAGDVLAGPSGDQRWRRAEHIEAEQQAAMNTGASVPMSVPMPPPSLTAGPRPYPTPPLPGTHHSIGIDPHTGASYNVPAPPPIPIGSSSHIGPATSVTSPGTETSEATQYADNRKRRRAERAQARLAREGRTGTGTGNTVDFT